MSNPILQPPGPPDPPRGSWLSIFLAVTLGSAALVILSFLTFNLLLPVVVIGGLIFVVAGCHYFVWGWWLSDLIRRAHEGDDKEP